MAGREEHVISVVGRAHRGVASLYRYRGQVMPEDVSLRLDLIRGRGLPVLPLDEVSPSLSWVDEQARLQGSMTVRRPEGRLSLPIGRGHVVRCRVRWQGELSELWRMRVLSPEVDPATGTITFDLFDDLDIVRREERDWVYRAGKGRPNGWLGHALAASALRTADVPIGQLAECTVRVKKLIKRRAPVVDVVREIYKREREKSGRKFVMRWQAGRLHVLPFQRNRELYVFEDQILEALLRQEGSARPVTVIQAKGSLGKGKGSRTVRHTEYDPAVVRRFGKSIEEKDFGRVDSLGELKAKAQRAYAKAVRVEHTGSLEVPGIPFIRRGDGIELRMPDEGYSGAKSFVYLTRVEHKADGGAPLRTSLEFTRTDPFLADQERRDKLAREKKRDARKAS
jgi:hypothetical protein